MRGSSAAKNIIKWMIFSFLILAFAAITYEVVSAGAQQTDEYFFQTYFLPTRTPALTVVAKILTFAGSAVGLIAVDIAAFFFFKDKKIWVCLTSNLILITVVNLIVKLIVTRARPDADFALATETTYSFPSGHSMASMAFYGLLLYFILRFVKNKPAKIVLGIFLPLLILAIGVSRIYLGVHYLSDVLGGFTLSLAWLIAYTAIINSIFAKARKKLN